MAKLVTKGNGKDFAPPQRMEGKIDAIGINRGWTCIRTNGTDKTRIRNVCGYALKVRVGDNGLDAPDHLDQHTDCNIGVKA